MTGIARGDSTAVRACITQHGRLVWALARRYSRSEADAEDATQEIFVEIWQNACRFDPLQGSETTFVAMLARRRLIDRFRKQRARREFDTVPLDSIAELHWIDSRTPTSDLERVLEVLSTLRHEVQQVLLLAMAHGLTQTEIAAQLSLPLGTVKSYMRRGLLQIRGVLDAAKEESSKIEPVVRRLTRSRPSLRSQKPLSSASYQVQPAPA